MTATSGEATAIAVAQFAPVVDVEANLAAIAELTTLAAGRGARVVVFPEYSHYFIDPFDASLAEHAESVPGPFTVALTDLAAAHGLHIVAGMVERAEGSRVQNTVVAVTGDGVIARYRKLHLYDAFGQQESDWVAPGVFEAPETFTIDGLRFGLLTCYDLRFPEVARTLIDVGVDVIVVPAEWVRGPLKEHHWRTLIHARAIENTVYLAAADHPPPLGIGHSMIVDPQGMERAAVGTGTDIAIAHADRATIDRVRRLNPSLKLRRFGVHPLS